MASVTGRVVFDPADTAGGHNVGAHLLAGTDGEAIDSTANAIHVYLDDQNGDVDVNISNASIAVTATQLDIDDLNATDDAVAAWLNDGSGSAIGSTAGALDVHIASGTLTTSDAALANSSVENTATAVSTTAVAVVSSALANRKYLGLANNENSKTLFYGKAGVTTANGWPLYPGNKDVWRIGASVAIEIIGETGSSSQDLRVLEAA